MRGRRRMEREEKVSRIRLGWRDFVRQAVIRWIGFGDIVRVVA